VQTRILACFVGGFLGVVAASPLNDSLHLHPAVAFSAIPIVGVFVGYVASLLIDVFTSSPSSDISDK